MLTGNPPGDWPYGAAFSIAPMSRLATKVLCKKAMQPAPWACIRVASSSKAVMKMTGSWQPDAVRCAATRFAQSQRQAASEASTTSKKCTSNGVVQRLKP